MEGASVIGLIELASLLAQPVELHHERYVAQGQVQPASRELV